MVKGLYTAYTGMIEEQRRLNVLSNNLANSDTTGFKKEGTVNQAFADTLAIRIKDSGTLGMPRGLGNINLGVDVGETYTDWSQGSFKVTDVQSNLALAGKGFFAVAVTDTDGNQAIRYTRDGDFTVDMNGYLRTSDGGYVLNQAGATNSAAAEANYVRVNPNLEYTISEQRQIYQNNQLVGNVGVVDIADYDYISKVGDNYYELVDGGAVVASDARVEQGTLETSNVNVVDEMVQMITIQRAYEAGQKMIQTEDSTLDKAVNTVGRV